MVIRTNLNSINAIRNFGINNSQVTKSIEKLASGFAINRASDDASGLAISKKMRSQITGLDQGTSNALEGIGLVQTAEGAMSEIHDMLNRIVELSTKSANGTLQDQIDREAIQTEVNGLVEEIDRIAQSTNYNGIELLNGNLSNGELVIKTNTYTETITTPHTTVEYVSKLNIDTSKSVTVGSFTIYGGVENLDFSYNNITGELAILSNTDMRIEGGSNAESIRVDDSAGTANLALNNVNITNSNASAFSTGDNDVYIELEGSNELSSSFGYLFSYAGLNVGEFGSITIDGVGELTATGGYYAAGIGSNFQETSGNITIKGGTIIATGSNGAAGIGSGYVGEVGDITITGGTITATGSTGAGIGSGQGGTSGDITITNGTITATCEMYGAGIGAGYLGEAGDIKYVEECVNATGGWTGGWWTVIDIGAGFSGTVGTITKIPLGYTPNIDTDTNTDYESSYKTYTTYTTTTLTKTITEEVYNGKNLILHVADQNETYNKIAIYIDSMRAYALNIRPTCCFRPRECWGYNQHSQRCY